MMVMQFVSARDLAPGMILGKAIHYSDFDLRKSIELSRGYRLTDIAVERLISSRVDGAFVEGADVNIGIVRTINEEIKNEAVSGIQNIAQKFRENPDSIDAESMHSLEKTSAELVKGLTVNNNLLVNIVDLKMYDDYTYHHSLSVAVMALAIGMQLGLTTSQLQNLTLSGLLHDIGKVAVPIEIINKPSRLTPEEFEIVKCHPMNAGVSLWKRLLVPADVYLGIISHHERFDGTGYPNHLVGKNIPLFGRILAVADVYDALTSQRSYRAPAPPNEAVEYIMGGIGSAFDEDIVKAFLHKVAAYPVGVKVRLSNDEIGTVLKNYPERPLRPIIAVRNGADIYDLYRDKSRMNIVITGLAEE